MQQDLPAHLSEAEYPFTMSCIYRLCSAHCQGVNMTTRGYSLSTQSKLLITILIKINDLNPSTMICPVSVELRYPVGQLGKDFKP